MPDLVRNLVSTIIPVHNRPAMVKMAVESVLAQDYAPKEIIIVNDGSTDDTKAVCQALARSNPETLLALHQENLGPGSARELGRTHARGEFIQYLDSDDRLLPGKFRVQVMALRQNQDCGIAYGKTRLADDAGKVLAEPFKWTGEWRDQLFPGLLVDRWWCTHTPLYRREVCDQIGPWSNLRYSQDWEYDARAGALSTRLIQTNEMVSEHRSHTSERQTGKGKWLKPREQLQFFRTLHESAVSAGVTRSSPEMRHFSRWVFEKARMCGKQGDPDTARALLKLAAIARGDAASDIRIYGVLTYLLGWKTLGRLAPARSAFSNKFKGKNSLKQSWME